MLKIGKSGWSESSGVYKNWEKSAPFVSIKKNDF